VAIYAGKLRHRVTVQRQRQGVDTFGEPASEWEDLYRLYCQVEPLTGEELVASKAVKGVETHRVTTRWGPKVDATMRLRWETGPGSSRIFEIVSISNIEERNREILILCKECDAESQTVNP